VYGTKKTYPLASKNHTHPLAAKGKTIHLMQDNEPIGDKNQGKEASILEVVKEHEDCLRLP
jgi:hypothetical protein